MEVIYKDCTKGSFIEFDIDFLNPKRGSFVALKKITVAYFFL